MAAPTDFLTQKTTSTFNHRIETLKTDEGVVYGCLIHFDDDDTESGQLQWAENELNEQLKILDGWQWWVGDYCNAVRKKHSHTWTDILPDPQNTKQIRSLSTLQYWTGVSQSFSHDRRRPELSPSHHAVISFISDEEIMFVQDNDEHNEPYMDWCHQQERNPLEKHALQDYILEIAVKADWSVRDVKDFKNDLCRVEGKKGKTKSELTNDLNEIRFRLNNIVWAVRHNGKDLEDAFDDLEDLLTCNLFKVTS